MTISCSNRDKDAWRRHYLCTVQFETHLLPRWTLHSKMKSLPLSTASSMTEPTKGFYVKTVFELYSIAMICVADDNMHDTNLISRYLTLALATNPWKPRIRSIRMTRSLRYLKYILIHAVCPTSIEPTYLVPCGENADHFIAQPRPVNLRLKCGTVHN